MLVCLIWTVSLAAAGPPHAPPASYAAGAYVLRGAAEGGRTFEIALPLPVDASTAPVELDLPLALPEGWPAIRLNRFLPRAQVQQSVEVYEGPDARSAVLLSIEGPTQTLKRWLVADDPAHNRLTSLLAVWRYMSVADAAARDELFAQFQGELTRAPRLLVRPAGQDAGHELDLRIGERQTLDGLSTALTVRAFFPHFALEAETKGPINSSQRRVNPAVQVAIEKDGRTQDVWVFTRHPDRGARAAEPMGLQLRLDCPLEERSATPDFVIVTAGHADHEVWCRFSSESTRATAALDATVAIPGSQYVFRLERFLPQARLTEEFRPGHGADAAPALCIECSDPAGAAKTVWLRLERPCRLGDRAGMNVTFSARPAAAPGAHP